MKSIAENIDWSEKYLKLLRETLTRAIDVNTIDYRHVSEVPSWIKPETEMDRAKIAISSFLADTVSSNSEEHWLEMRRCVKVDRRRVADGSQLHRNAETMVGLKRLENIEMIVRDVCNQDVPGDFVEVGVWRGGGSIYARACLDIYSRKDRMVYLYDTFSGFGRIEATNSRDWSDEHYKQDILVIGLQEVKDNFKKYGLLSESVVFVRGDVCETAQKHPETPIAILRLDVDLYDSTTAALQNLFPRIPSGGYVIVDDWQYEVQGRMPAQEAVADYMAAHGMELDVVPIDNMSVYFKKK